MTAFDEILSKERNDLPMSKLETALFTLWCDFNGYEKMATEAAEQTAALVEENKKLREALKPFAQEGREWSGKLNMANDSDYPIIRWQNDDDRGEGSSALFTVGDLRMATIVIEQIESSARAHSQQERSNDKQTRNHQSA